MKNLLTAPLLKTTEVGRLLGIPLHNLHNWVRHGVIPAPAKDGSSHFVWGPDDLARARKVWEERRPDRRGQAAA